MLPSLEIVSLSKPLLLQPETYKHITPNTLSVFQDESSWRKVNRVNTDFKFKELKSAEGLCSWNSLLKDEINLDSEDDCYSESSSSESSQTTTKFDVKEMKMFGSMPMEEETIVVKCNNCKRPFLPSRFKEHAESCLGDKLILIKHEEKELVSDDERSLKRRWESGKKQTIGKKKQKNKKEKDKQCGVIQTATNMPCTRSITCKTHSMGAKRSVKGRSQSYDLLLAAYQKKTIGRPNVQEQPTNIYKVKLMNEENNLIDSDDEMDTVEWDSSEKDRKIEIKRPSLPSINALLTVSEPYLSHSRSLNPSCSQPIHAHQKDSVNVILSPSDSFETTENDISEIIHHCSTLGRQMMNKRGIEISSLPTLKPWLDEMINKANHILNALLRLRKQQLMTNELDEERIFDVPKLRKRKRPKFEGKCHSCHTSETPEWRRGPNGARTLCNACGLNYAKLAKMTEYKDDTAMK
ncbi:hypothetical protein G6F38_000009 [Rhizopus arrhizus]|nr:hypothetical protein G6F38_000009 [Rhizopus arrhizus]